MLLLLLIVSAHNLLVSNLTWQSFLVHKLLIIGLNDNKPITWSSRLESWTRRVQPIAAMDRVVVVIVENTHLVA